MSVQSKHAYRFGFLKSEKWQQIRLRKLVKSKAHCAVCARQDVFNDAHHVRYRPRWEQTRLKDLVILCRRCHKAVHVLQGKHPEISQEEVLQWLRQERFEKKGFIKCCERFVEKSLGLPGNEQKWGRIRFFRIIDRMRKVLTASEGRV